MDIKKKTFLDNFNLKATFANLKKPGKKNLRRGRKLAHRRSISVPDLRAPDSHLVSPRYDSRSYGIAAGLSDTDSIASGSIADGSLYADKLNDSVSESRLRVPVGRIEAALNRMSAPVGLNVYEETDGMINVGSQNTGNLIPEGLYAQVDKRPKVNPPRFNLDPIPTPRSFFPNRLSPSPNLGKRWSLSGEDNPAVQSGAVDALLPRASSMGDQVNPYKEQSATSSEYRKPPSEKGTHPAIRANAPAATSLILDNLCTPVESADGNSLDSACGSTTEEQVNMPWTTDSEELDRELCVPFFMRDFTVEEALLEQAQSEETLEEPTEVSFITSVFTLHVT